MANPSIVTVGAATWTKVASSVFVGTVRSWDPSGGRWLETYRVAGGAAPTDLSDAMPFAYTLLINSSSPIDVYVYRTEGGKVRVDI